MSPIFFYKDQIISLHVIELEKKKMGKKYQGNWTERGVIKDMVITLMLLQNNSK